MKILLWPTLYLPNIGGLEKMVYTLVSIFRAQGHEVIVFSNAEEISKTLIEATPHYTFPFHSALNLYNLHLVQKILAQIIKILDFFRPDIVNLHGLLEYLAFYQFRVFEKQKTPICLTIHGLLEQRYYRVGYCEKLWKRVEAINTVSNALVLPQFHPFAQTIYNGLPVPTAAQKPLPRNQLLMIGRMTREKGFKIGFHAFKLLLEKRPELKLTMIGNGPDYEALSQLKESLKLPIDFLGFVSIDKVQSFIDQSTLILIPSLYESFSLVALEAALRGRPVVASSVMGLKEVIEDQKTGLLVEPNHPQELAFAIDTLLSNPLRMEEMAKAAFERASRIFSIETTANNYLKMYEQAIDLCRYSCP